MEQRPPEDAWSTAPQWKVVAVVAGNPLEHDTASRRLLYEHDGCSQHLVTGYALRLHRDSCESYWYNLTGRSPSLFVVLRETETGDLEPFVVTANYDEAGAYMESDASVSAAPMPAEIYHWLQSYVDFNFHPTERKARKRKDWSEDA